MEIEKRLYLLEEKINQLSQQLYDLNFTFYNHLSDEYRNSNCALVNKLKGEILELKEKIFDSPNRDI